MGAHITGIQRHWNAIDMGDLGGGEDIDGSAHLEFIGGDVEPAHEGGAPAEGPHGEHELEEEVARDDVQRLLQVRLPSCQWPMPHTRSARLRGRTHLERHLVAVGGDRVVLP